MDIFGTKQKPINHVCKIICTCLLIIKKAKYKIYQSCQSCQGLLQAKVTAPPIGMQHKVPENPLSLVKTVST